MADEFYICEETAGYGNAVPNPVWTKLRIDTCTLKLTKASRVTKGQREDKQIAGLRHGTRDVAGEITSKEMYYGEYDALFEAGMRTNWAVNTPALGTDQAKVGMTRRSFNVLRKLGDISDKPFLLYTGIEVNTFAPTPVPNGEIGIKFGLIGLDMSAPSATEPAGSSYATENSTGPMDSFVGLINIDDVGSAVVTEITPSLENGMQARKIIGQPQGIRPSIGSPDLKSTVTAYCDDMVLYERFLNEIETKVDLTIADAAGNAYKFILPAGKPTDGSVDTGDGDRMISLPMQFYYDAVSQTNMILERTPIA